MSAIENVVPKQAKTYRERMNTDIRSVTKEELLEFINVHNYEIRGIYDTSVR